MKCGVVVKSTQLVDFSLRRHKNQERIALLPIDRELIRSTPRKDRGDLKIDLDDAIHEARRRACVDYRRSLVIRRTDFTLAVGLSRRRDLSVGTRHGTRSGRPNA